MQHCTEGTGGVQLVRTGLLVTATPQRNHLTTHIHTHARAHLARYVQTLFFYAAMGVVAWSLTAPPRTSSARLNLLIGLLVVGAVEVIVLTRWSTLSSLIKASAELHGDGSAAHDFASLEGGASTTGLLPPPPAAVCPTWLPWMPNVLCSAAYSLLDVRWYTSTSAMLLALLWRRIAPSLFGLAASSVGASRTAAFIRLSLDPLSLETWDASTVAWALRE